MVHLQGQKHKSVVIQSKPISTRLPVRVVLELLHRIATVLNLKLAIAYIDSTLQKQVAFS